MYFVKMFDQVEKCAGFLSGDNEFDVREHAEEFETREEAEEALEEFLDTYYIVL